MPHGTVHAMETRIGNKLGALQGFCHGYKKLRHFQAGVLSALTGSFASALAFGLAFGFDRALISSQTCLQVEMHVTSGQVV